VRRARAAAGSLVFLLVGTVAVLLPWRLTDWEARHPHPWWPLRVVGVLLIAVGAVVLIQAFARFVVEGFGTPAPVAPPERLVVGGLYRYVRNPMYLALEATIIGQALVLGRFVLLIYAAALAVVFAAFVRWYEEPTLGRRYGAQYEQYRRAVPAWLPRRPSGPRSGAGRTAPRAARSRPRSATAAARRARLRAAAPWWRRRSGP